MGNGGVLRGSLREGRRRRRLAAGLTVHEVADLLGHTTPALVVDRYGHAIPRQRAMAGDRLEAFLQGGLGT
jgi:hypothetical protein